MRPMRGVAFEGMQVKKGASFSWGKRGRWIVDKVRHFQESELR